MKWEIVDLSEDDEVDEYYRIEFSCRNYTFNIKFQDYELRNFINDLEVLLKK